MAAELTATVKASISWSYVKAVTGLSTDSENANTLSYSKALTNGTGAVGTADLIYVVQSSIAASGNVSYDLAGSLTDFFGTTITMARVKFLYVNLTSDTTGSSVSIGNATNPLANWISTATETVKIFNDGVFLIGSGSATGYAVSAGSADAVKVLNNDGSNVSTVNFCAIGSSA